MRFWILLVVALGLVCGTTGQVRAAVLDFEGITGAATGQITAGYGGFTWDANFYVASDATFASYGNSYGSPSGNYAAFNAFGVLSVMTSSGADFDFNGASVTGWAAGDAFVWHTATSLTVEGYNNGGFVGSVTMATSADKYDWMDVSLAGVDELRFISSAGGQWWLLDDFTYNEPIIGGGQIPEPTTLIIWSLLGAFGIGLGAWRGRRQGAPLGGGASPARTPWPEENRVAITDIVQKR